MYKVERFIANLIIFLGILIVIIGFLIIFGVGSIFAGVSGPSLLLIATAFSMAAITTGGTMAVTGILIIGFGVLLFVVINIAERLGT